MIKEDVFKKCPVCGMPFVSVEVESEPCGYNKDGFPVEFEHGLIAKCVVCDNTFIVHGRDMKQLEEAWNELCREIKSDASNKKLLSAQHDTALQCLLELFKYTYKKDCRKCIFCIGQKDDYYIDGHCALPECPSTIPRYVREAIAERAQALRADTCDR